MTGPSDRAVQAAARVFGARPGDDVHDDVVVALAAAYPVIVEEIMAPIYQSQAADLVRAEARSRAVGEIVEALRAQSRSFPALADVTTYDLAADFIEREFGGGGAG